MSHHRPTRPADRHGFDAIIDARSPAEFAADHIPGAINCPVLDDEERCIGRRGDAVEQFADHGGTARTGRDPDTDDIPAPAAGRGFQDLLILMSLPLLRKPFLQCIDHLSGIDGLGHVHIGPGFQGPLAGLGRCQGRDHHEEWHGLDMGLDLLCQFHAIHLGHHPVGQYGIDRFAAEEIESLRPVLRGDDLVLLFAQHLLQQHQTDRIIFNDQNLHDQRIRVTVR